MNGKLYIIGGSPCSGKSTIAERIRNRFGFTYFKVDENLEEYIERGASENKRACKAVKAMTPETIWMRSPKEQNKEEFAIYREIFPYICEDIDRLPSDKPIITEGAAFYPKLIKGYGIDYTHYVALTPTAEFQNFYYRQRPWVPYVLNGCGDREKAFSNWMARDVLFGEEVRRQCEELGYLSIVNEGKSSIVEIEKTIITHLGIVSNS